MEGGREDLPDEWFHYGECMRNYAAPIGSTATDGCGEFLPKVNSPGSLICAACLCHRSFHRKSLFFGSLDEDDDNQQIAEQVAQPMELAVVPGQQQIQQMAAPSIVRAVAEPQAAGVKLEEIDGRKRPRTTFSSEQKESMRVFAEDLGWKMVRYRSDEINRFCNEIGVTRLSFKIWMHNHKHSCASFILASMAAMNPAAGADRDNSASSSRPRT